MCVVCVCSCSLYDCCGGGGGCCGGCGGGNDGNDDNDNDNIALQSSSTHGQR